MAPFALAGVCDTHMHFYDQRWPTAPTTVLTPPDASVADYRRVTDALGIGRTVVVQPTTYGLDNRCQLEAMAQLGPQARGVMVVNSETSDDELEQMTGLGVRGARFHMLPGGAVGWDELEPVAERIADFGWHIQLQLDGRELPSRLDQLLHLGERLVIDHVGRFMPPVPVDHKAFAALLKLVDRGAWVKLSAPYESAPDPSHRYDEVTTCVQELLAKAPDQLLWATNWPHPGQSNPPSVDQLAAMARRWLPTAELQQKILVHNPAQRYGF